MTDLILSIRYSFVIPTYNRAELVTHSIRSALAWVGEQHDAEIVVVDNASQDGTVERLRREFFAEIGCGVMRIVARSENGGVIRSKNDGGRAAKGEWLIYLDSDDLIKPSEAVAMRTELNRFKDRPLIFFRCEDIKTGDLMGEAQAVPVQMELRQFLNQGTYSECLPVIRKDVFARFPYDEGLDGWEGITYARILKNVGPLTISPIIARRYRAEGNDRLTSARGLKLRARSMAHGHWLLLKEFWGYLTISRRMSQITKVLYYYARILF